MQIGNASALCEKRGFRWQLTLRNGLLFEIGTSEGWYSLPTRGEAPKSGECVSAETKVNGDVVTLILESHQPPKGFNDLVRRG
jgi:hypothetical protein